MKTAEEYIAAKNRRLEINNEIREIETQLSAFREVMSIIFLPLYFNISIYDKENNKCSSEVRSVQRAIDNCIIQDNGTSVLFQSRRDLAFSMEHMIQTEFIVNRDSLANIIELYDVNNLEPSINLAYEYFKHDQNLNKKSEEHSDKLDKVRQEIKDLENTIGQLCKMKIPETDPTMQKVVAKRESVSHKLVLLGEEKVGLSTYNVLPLRVDKYGRYLLPDGNQRSVNY